MIRQRILMLVICCFFASTWAMAQRSQVKGVKSNMTEETKAALNLSAEQIVELNALQDETSQAIEAVRREGGDRGTAMREIRANDEARLAEILTKDQMSTLQVMRGERVEERVAEGDRTVKEERTRERTEEQKERTRERTDQMERTRERVRPEKADRRGELSEADRTNLKADIESYRAQNIEPVMATQHQKLVNMMSAEDRARMMQVRNQLATEKALRNADQNKEVVAMVSKYDTEITRLLAEIEPMEAQWKADQSAIRASYMGQNDRVRSEEGETRTRLDGGSTAPTLDEKIRFMFRSANGERR